MFRKIMNITLLTVVITSSAVNFANARGGNSGGDGADFGDGREPVRYEEPSRTPDKDREPGRPTEVRPNEEALGCLQMVVVDPTVPNASEYCGYDL